jgi:hypothetical protein
MQFNNKNVYLFMTEFDSKVAYIRRRGKMESIIQTCRLALGWNAAIPSLVV